MALDSRVASTVPEQQALIAERFAAAYEVQLRQLTQQAREEQEALTADMEMLRQAACHAQQTAAEHRARVHLACQELGARRLGITTLQAQRHELRGAELREAQQLQQERQRLQEEQRRLQQLNTQVSLDGQQLRFALQNAQQRLQHEEQVASHLYQRLSNALAERDKEAALAQQHERREKEALAMKDAARENLRRQEENTKHILQEAERHLQADAMSPQSRVGGNQQAHR